MMNYTIEQAKIDLQNINNELSLYDKMLKVASIITKVSEDKNIYNMPIVVGGLSMEIYTGSQYTTQDIDFVTSASIRLKKVLMELGFTHESRIYIYESLGVAVDIPDTALEFSEAYDRLIKFELDENSDDYVYVISIEDILLDRLEDYGHADNERYVKYLLTVNYSNIDFEYIKKELSARDKDALINFNQWIEDIENQINTEK